MPRRNQRALEDKRIWARMGRELAALNELIGQAYTDKQYGKVMDCKTWDRLSKIDHHLNMLRAEAESRMARFIPDWSTTTFYPYDREDLREIGRAHV